jgi:hypothetical protein
MSTFIHTQSEYEDYRLDVCLENKGVQSAAIAIRHFYFDRIANPVVNVTCPKAEFYWPSGLKVFRSNSYLITTSLADEAAQ